MADCGERRDPVPFAPLKLVNFPHYFTEEEHAELVKWGTQATELASGSAPATSPKERIFIEVTKGLRPPETRFQRLWLRYLQAVAIESKLSEAEGKANYHANLLYAAQPLLIELTELKRQANFRSGQMGCSREVTESNSDVRDGVKPIRQLSAEVPVANPENAKHTKPAWRKAWEERETREQWHRDKPHLDKDGFTPNGLFACTSCRGVGRSANGYWCLKCDGKGKVRR